MKHLAQLKTTLAKPSLPTNLPTSAQWLAGEGAGSWFVLSKNDTIYTIDRYSSDGRLECNGFFLCQDHSFDFHLPFHVTYLSHCQTVTIIQDDRKIIFERN